MNHPGNTTDTNWKLLADFRSGGHILKQAHENWLNYRVVSILSSPIPRWVYLRGYGSELGIRQDNQTLNRRRAVVVQMHLIRNLNTVPDRIIGVEFNDGIGRLIVTVRSVIQLPTFAGSNPLLIS